jgi:hypothetical protein
VVDSLEGHFLAVFQNFIKSIAVTTKTLRLSQAGKRLGVTAVRVTS